MEKWWEEAPSVDDAPSGDGGLNWWEEAPKFASNLDTTDDARAKRGFGRTAYQDGLVDAPDIPGAESAGEKPGAVRPKVEGEEEPSQTLSDFGSRFARGATEIGAGLPEAAAIYGAGNPNVSAAFADEEVKRSQEQIKLAERKLRDTPGMPEEMRARIEGVITEERRKIESYKPLVDIAEGPLRPAPEDRPLYKLGDRTRAASQELFGTPDPQFDDRFLSKLSEGAGSMAGFVGVTMLTGLPGGAVAGSALNTSGMYRRAKEEGATEEEARQAAYIGSIVGATEVVPIGRALKMLPEGVRSKVAKGLGQRLANAFATAGEEGVQEAAVEIANNITEKFVWNEEQGVFEGAGESALIGAILGGGLGAMAPTSKGDQQAIGPGGPPADRERRNSPRLTPEDRESPIPNDLIDDGKAFFEQATDSPTPPTPAAQEQAQAPDMAGEGGFAPTETPRAPERPAAPEAGTAPSVDRFEILPEVDASGETGRMVQFDNETGEAVLLPADATRPDQGSPEGMQEPSAPDGLPEIDQSSLSRGRTPDGDEIAQAASEAEIAPTDPQKEAGNYKKGRFTWNGLDISIENAKGSERKGTDPDGNEWSVTMPGHYGYVRKTEGADGDHVDIYMGDNPKSDVVVVIDQVDADSKEFDEHKVILGTNGQEEAEALYDGAFSDGRSGERLGGSTVMTVEEFKTWVRDGDTSKPLTDVDVAPVKTRAQAMKDLREQGMSAPSAKPQKSPFINAMRQNGMRIDPNGEAAKELASRDITPRTAPNLFKKGGLKSLDNLELDRWREQYPDAADDGTGNYVDPEWIYEQIDSEVAGEPRPGLEQQRIAQEKEAWEEAIEAEMRGDDLSAPENDDTPKERSEFVIPRDEDISTDEERSEYVRWAVNRTLDDLGISDTIDQADRGAIVTKVNRDGGDIYDAIYDHANKLLKEAEQTAAEAFYRDFIPFDTEEIARYESGTQTEEAGETVRPVDASPERAGKPERDTQGEGQSQEVGKDAGSDAGQAATGTSREGWVIREKGTGEVVMETKDPAKVDALNTSRYEAVPVQQHLADLNRETPAARAAGQTETTPSESLTGEIITPDDDAAVKRNAATEAGFELQPPPLSQQTPSWWNNISRAGRDLVLKQAKPSTRRELRDGMVFENLSDDAKRDLTDAFGVLYRDRKLENTGTIEAPVFREAVESTEAGEQNVIPGAEQDAARSERARESDQRREVDARAQQSKMRTNEPQDGPGGLFDTQGDLLDQAETTEKKPSRAQKRLTDALRKEWEAREAIPDSDTEAFLEASKKVREARAALAEEFGEDVAAQAVEQIESDYEARTGNKAGEAPDQAARSERIEDFGEKIGGAQKDKVRGWLNRASEVSDAEIATVPLSKSWPEPNYQELLDAGVDPEAVAFIHAARDEIPNKPRSSFKVKRWANQVQALREFSTGLINGTYDMATVKEQAKSSGMKGFMGRVDLYERFGHEKSLKGVSMSEGSYSIFMGERFDQAKDIWTVSVKRQIKAHGETKEAAMDAFAETYAEMGGVNSRGKGTKFEIRKWRGGNVFIGKKVGKDWIEVATDPEWDWADARKYLVENHEALEAELARKKKLPPERGESNSPRVGEDHRNGQDVTPDMFTETFGFRGVQFGEYVEGPRRQQDINEAYDGLMDLAGVIGVPPKAMSLNGSLGLAFGARGSGRKAAAHYEPGQVVINLTKKQGAGSLAHEWWHAMDHYFAQQGGRSATLLTENTRGLSDGLRPEVLAEFESLTKLIRRGELKVRSQTADKRKSKPYFSKMEEMTARSFESYVIGKLQDQSQSNDYLANILSEDAWNALEESFGQDKPSWPYVKASEMPEFREAFDKLFDVIETEASTRVNDAGETIDTVRMYQRQISPFYSPLLRAIEGAKQKQAQAKDWKAILSKMPGVKQAEIEWLGVNEWLDAQDGQVRREDIAEFVRESQIEMVEDRLGQRPEGFYADFEILRDDEIAEGWSDADIEEQVLADAEMAGTYAPAQFENYTEPGGENYREVLLRVPDLHRTGKNNTFSGRAKAIWRKMDALAPYDRETGRRDTSGLSREQMEEYRDLRAQFTEQMEKDRAEGRSNDKRPFVQSAHFEQENIVVHARIKDRTGPNGEKVLFVEEIQSDLASVWRENQEAPEVTARRRELKEARNRIEDVRGEVYQNLLKVSPYKENLGPRDAPMRSLAKVLSGDMTIPEKPVSIQDRFLAEARDLILAREPDAAKEGQIRAELLALGTEKRIPEGTPDTPFQQEHTYNLMVKRLLRMAAEEGYDRLSWTPGYMQAERWNSAAQSVVEDVIWNTRDNGEKSFRLNMSGGRSTIIGRYDSRGVIYESDARELNGKTLSALVGPKIETEMTSSASGEVRGEKITFPDSGYAIAYDQQTRKSVDKLAKGTGAKVRVDKTLPDFKRDDIMTAVREMEPSTVRERLIASGAISETTAALADKAAAERNDHPGPEYLHRAFVQNRDAEIAKALSDLHNPVWSIDITDALRAKALEPMAILRRDSVIDEQKVSALLPDLKKRLDKMAIRNVDIRFEPGMTEQGATEIRPNGDITILIGAALNDVATLNHEAIHVLRARNLFKEREWDSLRKAAEKDWIKRYDIEARYPDLDREGQIEEAAAEAFAEWTNGGLKVEGDAKGPLARIKRFFKALIETLRGQGITTPSDVFRNVEGGAVGGRDISTEEFSRWFGDSKVVDRYGVPLVVYHGTRTDFDQFQVSPKKARRTLEKDAGSAFWFASKKEVAESYSSDDTPIDTVRRIARTDTPRVEEVYLSIQNPLVIDMRGKPYSEAVFTDAIEAAKDGGRDGVIIQNTKDDGYSETGLSTDVYAAFQPTQVKSVDNRGTFSQNDPRIAYQRERGMPPASYLPERHVHAALSQENSSRFSNIKAGAADLFERGRINIQDRFLPLKKAVLAAEKQAGEELPPSMNPYKTEEQMAGQVGRDLDDIEELYLQPVIDILAETKGDLTTENVGHWLNARHAKERNAHISKINPKYDPGSGSGLTDAEADRVLEEFANSPHKDKLEKIGRIVDDLREFTIQTKEDSGLLSKSDTNALRKMYQFYVPLRGFAETDHADATLDVTGIGRRLNVKGQESKRALGRDSLAYNPLVGAFTQAQEAAIRAGKNRVGNALYELVEANPSDAWSIQEVKQRRYYNSANGMVVTATDQAANTTLEDNEFATKVDGKEYRIKIEDPRLARAVGNVGSQQFGIIVRSLMGFSRYFSATNTMLNPEFMITNALRDFTTAQVNIQGFGKEQKNELGKAMAKNWKNAFKGAWIGMGNTRSDHPWAKHFREYEEAGGKVSFWQIDDPNKASLNLEKRIKRSSSLAGKARSTLLFNTRENPILREIERVNLAIDNAIRLAAFVEARKLGWTEQDAASLAKNLTVNFNRRGEMTPVLNGLYPFFNAAMQGTHILLTAMKYKRPRRIVAALFAYGILEDMVNSWLSEEDEDGELAWDKVPDWKLRRNILINADGEDPWSIPLPYGYNVFPYAGKQLSKTMRGVKEPGEAVAHLLAATLESVSPISGQGIFEAATPTILKPAVEVGMNRDMFLDRPIAPKKWSNDAGLPDAYNHYRSTPEFWKEVSDIMNRATGGNSLNPGVVDVSPDVLEHLFGFGTGGAGRFVDRMVDLGAKMALGDIQGIEKNDIPFVRQLSLETGDWLDRSRYYEFSQDVQEALNREKVSRESGERMTAKDRTLVKLKPISKSVSKKLRALRKIKYAVYDADMPRAERTAKIEDIRAKEMKLYLDFNSQYLALMGKQGE